VRVLGIETSSRRGTVALVEDGHTVATLGHEVPNGHAERMLGLVDRLLADAGWAKTGLDRIAVGVGPGSFTGIRVGIALAQGLALGLDRPVLGIGSLHAMSRGVPDELDGTRCAMVDAHRNELFCAEYAASGEEVRAPLAVRRDGAGAWLAEAREPRVVIGEIATSVGVALEPFRSDLTDLPHAAGVALLGSVLAPERAPTDAVYARPADAIRPNLPRSPLSSGTST
jgi:tRNA threonylcarbamoyladenosine biosynthesis protein TsaB